MSKDRPDREKILNDVVEIVAEIWRSGKTDSQVFDFHECSIRQKWVARLIALFPEDKLIIDSLREIITYLEAKVKEVTKQERERIIGRIWKSAYISPHNKPLVINGLALRGKK